MEGGNQEAQFGLILFFLSNWRVLMATVQELRDRLYHKLAGFDRQLCNLMHNPATNEPSLEALDFPDDKVGDLCFQFCSTHGLGTLIGGSIKYDALDPKRNVRPFIVRAAMPSAIDRLHNLCEVTQKVKPAKNYVPGGAPMLSPSTAQTFFKEVLRGYGAFFTIKRCHESIHNGAMVEHLGEKGMSWGPKFFCPTFHLLELQVQDFDEILAKRKDVFCVIADSQFANEWVTAIEAGMGREYVPWWFGDQMK
jgi:hypothetical protein